MAGMLTRAQRFQQYTQLAEELKDGAEAPLILTRLYNGLTTELSKAEAEIKNLRDALSTATAELATMKAMAIQVSR